MIRRYRDGQVPGPQLVPAGGEELDAACRRAGDRARTALAEFDFRQATAAVWAIADEANRLINRVRPWELARAEREGDAGAGHRLDAVLGALFAACSALGRELGPFLPDAAARIASRCTPPRWPARPGLAGVPAAVLPRG
jgi:methionyl-tRNA synthetase